MARLLTATGCRMKINWPIMRDEMINVGGAMVMAALVLGLVGIGFLWIGGV